MMTGYFTLHEYCTMSNHHLTFLHTENIKNICYCREKYIMLFIASLLLKRTSELLNPKKKILSLFIWKEKGACSCTHAHRLLALP